MVRSVPEGRHSLTPRIVTQDSAGLAEVQRIQGVELGRIEELGGSGREPWSTFLRRGLGERTRRDQEWLTGHVDTLRGRG